MTIVFKPHTDKGSPTFTQDDDTYIIVCEPGDRGRWLGDYPDPLQPGQAMKFLAEARVIGPETSCASLLLTWWKDEPGMSLHSIEHVGELCGDQQEFKLFSHTFITPSGVKLLRADLRSWSGQGTRYFKNISITKANEPPPPPPDNEIITIGIDFVSVHWRVTASKDSITALRTEKEE